MAMATAAPRSTASSTAFGAGAPGADTISGVARSRMAATASSAATLTGNAAEDARFKQRLERAENLLLEDKYNDAYEMFDEIYTEIEKVDLPKTSFIPIRCLIGLADSLSTDEDRSNYVTRAYHALNSLYAQKDVWRPEEVSPSHSELRWYFKKLKPLIPARHDATIAEIETKIEECAKFILPFDAMNEKVKEADEAFKADPQAARPLYEEALELSDGKNEIEFKLSRVHCLLNLTSAYHRNGGLNASTRDRAQAAIFELFDQRGSLYALGKYTRVNAFTILIGYLRALRHLTPISNFVNRDEIHRKIHACKLEIPDEARRLPATDRRGAASGPAGSHPLPGGPPKKVTPGSPDGSWNLGRLFMAVVCIAALAVATVALYRRYSVKISE